MMADDMNNPANAVAPPNGVLPDILTAEDVARLFHVSISEARRLIVGGRVGRHFKVGRRHFIQRAALIEALAALEKPAHPDAGGLLRRRFNRAQASSFSAEAGPSAQAVSENS
jgi:hypothetical protein